MDIFGVMNGIKGFFEVIVPIIKKPHREAIITNVPVFRRLNWEMEEVIHNTLYYLGGPPTRKDNILNLAVLILAILGFPLLEKYLLRDDITQYMTQQNRQLAISISNVFIYCFILISFLAIILIAYRENLIMSIFPNYTLITDFRLNFPGKKLNKLRTASYLLLFLTISGIVQIFMILFSIQALKLEYSEILPQILVWSLVWVFIFYRVDRSISNRIWAYHMISLLELRRLPYVELGLSDGYKIKGLILDPFTDKTYLIMIDPDDYMTRFFVPWDQIRWFKLKTKIQKA
ncbi:hypothetical protein [Thermococcus barossii]|uniref:Uncharacterized protein n=1 Tax=Thermococcus barossii TaxID=54077 RepID=A0A2Z2MI00_9EURY|nr:hypothetical protein [Thermococcus barossii]ASJ04355.1 hypothetical protein A3L01_02875 [Thermococcus barossii]